ncbi:MAG: transposase [Gemmataceae bacterium]
MPRYRRAFVPGGTYFFTAVTHQRRPILLGDSGRRCLRAALAAVRQRFPFGCEAIVLLPDHLHTIWTLPPGDDRYDLRWQRFKRLFTDAYLSAGGVEGDRTASRVRRQERGVWQRRFWEHTVRDEDDFKRCLDYLHYNPVKHGLASRVTDYPWSTFHRWVTHGEYEPEWGTGFVCPDIPGAEWE